jgi:hypothetical protein
MGHNPKAKKHAKYAGVYKTATLRNKQRKVLRATGGKFTLETLNAHRQKVLQGKK